MDSETDLLKERQQRGGFALAGILLIGLAVRLALLAAAWQHSAEWETLHTVDTPSYVSSSAELLSHGTFSRDGVVEVMRTPGYPVFLIPGLILGHVEIVTVVLQILLSLATIWITYQIASTLSVHCWSGLAAALLMALEPLSVSYSCYLMCETLFSFLVMFALYSLVVYLRTAAPAYVVLAVSLLIAAAFVRPVGMYLVPALAVLLLLFGLVDRSRRLTIVTHALLFGVLGMTPIAAWQVRNYVATGYDGFSAIAEWNLYFFNAAAVVAQNTGRSFDQVQTDWGHFDLNAFYDAHPDLRGRGPAAMYHVMRDEGRRIINAHRWDYAKIHLRGMAALVLNPAATDACELLGVTLKTPYASRAVDTGILGLVKQMYYKSPLVFFVNLALAVPLMTTYGFSLLGLWIAFRKDPRAATLLTLSTGYFLILAGGPTGVARLRHPAMGGFCILGGIGIAQALLWLKQARTATHLDTAEPPLIEDRRAA